MPRFPLRLALGLSVLAGAFVAATSAATAQPVDSQKTEEVKKQDPVPPATAPKLSEQAGTTEPSGKVHNTSPDANAVFVNGVLAVPGASSDVDTAPAKHWARSDADDQLPIAGYRLKALKADQLRLISRELSSQRDAPTASPASGAYAEVGAEVPADIARRSLSPIPDALAQTFVELSGTAFMRSGGKIVIVDPKNNVVVGVLEG